MLGAVVFAAITILAWSQPWFTLVLRDSADVIEVSGDIAGGSLAALGLAGFALVAALSIAGPGVRVALGILEMLIGATVVLTTATALAEPAAASRAALTVATGVSGQESVITLVASATATAWPFVGLVAGIALFGIGAGIVVLYRRWPASSRKYQTARSAPDGAARTTASTEARTAAGPEATPSGAVADWDALSDGNDPTER